MNRQLYAVKHANFHLSMSYGSVSTPGNKKLSYLANASSGPREVVSSKPTRSNEWKSMLCKNCDDCCLYYVLRQAESIGHYHIWNQCWDSCYPNSSNIKLRNISTLKYDVVAVVAKARFSKYLLFVGSNPMFIHSYLFSMHY